MKEKESLTEETKSTKRSEGREEGRRFTFVRTDK